MTRSWYAQWGKRAVDLAFSLPVLLLISPFMLLLAGLVRLLLGHPVLFRQERPGLRGGPFVLLKFRTMTDARDRHGNLLPDAKRLTRFGRLLRSTSLDELPEIWNVLRGDMSLVGPRPLLVRYLDRYTPQQARRHEVRPGITGLAQVSGRNTLTWEAKFELDVQYVETASLALDVRILAATLSTVLRRSGISSEDHATAAEFLGSPVQRDP